MLTINEFSTKYQQRYQDLLLGMAVYDVCKEYMGLSHMRIMIWEMYEYGYLTKTERNIIRDVNHGILSKPICLEVIKKFLLTNPSVGDMSFTQWIIDYMYDYHIIDDKLNFGTQDIK